MPKLSIVKGATSVLGEIFIQDTSGAGLTGLTSASSGLACYRGRADDGNAGGTAISLTSTGTLGTWASGWFKEKDAANMPGVYEVGYTNASLASGSRFVVIIFKGAANMAPCVLEIELTGWDNQDAVHGGMSAIPNASPGAAGGLFIAGSNAATTFATLTVTGATTFTGNVAMAAGMNITQSTTNGTALVITGNGSGNGITATGGISAGVGMSVAGGGGNAEGLLATGSGNRAGGSFVGGATGSGLRTLGGATSGNGASFQASGKGAGLALFGVGVDGSSNPFPDLFLSIPLTNMVLAKATNITGFNDILATSIVSAGAITTSSGAVVNVTNVTSAVASVTAGVTLADGAITEAKITMPAEGTGQVTGLLGMVMRIYRRFFGKTMYDKIGNTVTMYKADNVTPCTVQTTLSTSSLDEVNQAT